MARPKKNSIAVKNNAATLGYEAQLWQMADFILGNGCMSFNQPAVGGGTQSRADCAACHKCQQELP